MKISLDLDNVMANYEYEETVGQVIREEINNLIRLEVRKHVKERSKEIQAEVAKLTTDALKQFKSDKVKAITQAMIKGMGAQ